MSAASEERAAATESRSAGRAAAAAAAAPPPLAVVAVVAAVANAAAAATSATALDASPTLLARSQTFLEEGTSSVWYLNLSRTCLRSGKPPTLLPDDDSSFATSAASELASRPGAEGSAASNQVATDARKVSVGERKANRERERWLREEEEEEEGEEEEGEGAILFPSSLPLFSSSSFAASPASALATLKAWLATTIESWSRKPLRATAKRGRGTRIVGKTERA